LRRQDNFGAACPFRGNPLAVDRPTSTSGRQIARASPKIWSYKRLRDPGKIANANTGNNFRLLRHYGLCRMTNTGGKVGHGMV
jgi:hypothetical protein